MNFIKQIEAALLGINQARFQDLINHLLHVQGYKFIGAPGSVVAKEKTSKGAPDSFFLNGDKYVFVECTTKERLGNSKSFFNKLEEDIVHCFEEERTSINAGQIEKVILACTEKITPEEHNLLKIKVRESNTEATFEVFNIQNLPLLIYDFPGLAEQYLGVTIVKGEIYNLPDFLLKTTKGLQPSLTNEFVGREEEIKESLSQLHKLDILVLSGPAGVGKSKLAVMLLEEVAKQNFIPIVIQSSAIPLWDDFVNLFQNEKDYVILFDDANKSVQNLSYLLDFIQKPKANKLKVIITSRDYVKQQVSEQLSNSSYGEIVISKLKDEQIEKIISTAMPTLEYYRDIKKKIVELSKGNARVALMATYSVTPEAETNYLSSPVLLYEKYFEKISQEIKSFSKPITLQALAIVSFFGTLDRNNSEIRIIIESSFNLDWDELWTTILELHSQEILNVYSNEVVKVSDQVLATYAFYKCFVDDKSAIIDYAKWITKFLITHPSRIKNSLIDVNNTFNYGHVKDLVLPHLQTVIDQVIDTEVLYQFHSLFWFYKGYDTLIYLKSWSNILPIEPVKAPLKFTYVHNDHPKPDKYIELLVGFWDYENELLKPSIELAIDLVAKQPANLPAILKFVNDHFSYTWEDVQGGYTRQNTLLDTLLNETRSKFHKEIAGGIFLNIAEKLLGWHFSQFSSKGIQFTIYNFDLHNSTELLRLRAKLLQGFISFFEVDIEQSHKILEKIIYPGGVIDKQIYVDELPFYEKLIPGKLSVNQFSHCKFVKRLARHLLEANKAYPTNWDSFINSDLMTLSNFLKMDFEDKDGKSWQERENEKRKELQDFVLSKEWFEIEYLLFSIDYFYKQQKEHSKWFVDRAISEIFIAIALKDKSAIDSALNLFFGGKLTFPLSTGVLNFILNSDVLSGKELLSIINNYNFKAKNYWVLSLLIALPADQVDVQFLKLLIYIFKSSKERLSIYTMKDFLKYDLIFEDYKFKNQILNLKIHNIITYLTELSLNKKDNIEISFGYAFCHECAVYFENNMPLLKQAYIHLKNEDKHFDYDGKELEAVLKLDNNFFVEYLEQKAVDFNYISFKLENFKPDPIWTFTNYKEILHKSLKIIINKAPVFSNWEHSANVLFKFRQPNDELAIKAQEFITEFIELNYFDRQAMKMIMNIALYQFRNEFLRFLKEILILNKELEILKNFHFNTGGVYSGSRVPQIQREMDLCKEIMDMMKTLPDVLDYGEHVKHMEQRIVWLKKDIKREQRSDFEELYQ